jgi:hypothetical protein
MAKQLDFNLAKLLRAAEEQTVYQNLTVILIQIISQETQPWPADERVQQMRLSSQTI